MLTKRIGILFAAVAAGTLAGCGGGGGGNVRAEQEAPPAPAPSASAPPDRVERPVQTTAYRPTTAAYTRPAGAAAIATDPEYRGLDDRGRNLNWALEAVKAADAYARLEAKYGAGTVPGAGQRIAVIDTGIDIVHGEIAPAYVAGRVSYTRLLGARREPYLNDDVEWEISHGTAVSSLILASKDASRQPWSFHGIAHGARLDMYGVMSRAGTKSKGGTAGSRWRRGCGSTRGTSRGRKTGTRASSGACGSERNAPAAAAWPIPSAGIGGGGGNRTRVRKCSALGSTCLAASFRLTGSPPDGQGCETASLQGFSGAGRGDRGRELVWVDPWNPHAQARGGQRLAAAQAARA